MNLRRTATHEFSVFNKVIGNGESIGLQLLLQDSIYFPSMVFDPCVGYYKIGKFKYYVCSNDVVIKVKKYIFVNYSSIIILGLDDVVFMNGGKKYNSFICSFNVYLYKNICVENQYLNLPVTYNTESSFSG